MRKKLKKNESAITLVALIVTIVVLLILAGITLIYMSGENGILDLANKTKGQTEIENIKEQIKLEVLTKTTINNGNVSEEEIKEILEKYGALSKEEKLMDRTLTTFQGNHAIKVSDIFNGTTGGGSTPSNPGDSDNPTGDGEGNSLIDKYKTPIEATDVQLFGREVNYHVPSSEVSSKIGKKDAWVLLYKGKAFSKTRSRGNLSYYEAIHRAVILLQLL